MHAMFSCHSESSQNTFSVSRLVFILFLDLLTQQILGILFLNAEERPFRREREVPGEEREGVKNSEKESDSSGIRRNAALSERSKECGAGRSGREDFHSEKTLSYWQLASVVVNEGEESYTTNLCQMRFNNFFEGRR